jgi:hypothetical protein
MLRATRTLQYGLTSSREKAFLAALLLSASCTHQQQQQQCGCYNALHAFLFSTAAGVINFASTSFSHIHSLIQGSYIFVLRLSRNLVALSLSLCWQYVLNVHEQIIHLRCWGERTRKCNGGHWSLRALRTPCTLYIYNAQLG